ncbi:MAG: 50S ribosomal protein L11 methyltransferase [Methylophilaceae bacterium]|nr:50S ribosomal protein L11 methyltransferase [Methylophilaceae bacterium]
MAWLLLKIQANDENAESISDALMELGALSASIEDAHAETQSEQVIFGEPGDPPPGIWQQNIVTAMLDESADVAKLLQALQTETQIPQFSYVTETIEEQDWVRATQAQFDPIHITDKLWIVPTWHMSPNQNAINIILDPGLAFGTGSHPTTHLCLEWLTQQSNLHGADILDYGCGSGILAIAAKKLGSNNTVGVDIDEQAVVSSRFNAEQNETTDIDFYDANDFGNQTFDVVVANILSSALMVLAPALAKYCKTGGNIALSGVLEEQAEALIARYSEWFTMDVPTQKDAWILLTGIKK